MLERASPELVEKMVAFDVGPGETTEASCGTLLFFLFYQLWNVLCFLLCRCCGDLLVRTFIRIFLPTCPTPSDKITARMSYPYWYTWRRGPSAAQWKTHGYSDGTKEIPSCPTLFLHGTKGWQIYGPERWVKRLLTRPANRVEAMPTNHWIMTEGAALTNRYMDEFLSAKTKARRG